jgi:hypothetical protein
MGIMIGDTDAVFTECSAFVFSRNGELYKNSLHTLMNFLHVTKYCYFTYVNDIIGTE